MVSVRVALLVLLVGCNFRPGVSTGAGDDGGGGMDVGTRIDSDQSLIDARLTDASPIDAGLIDAAPIDAAPIDAPLQTCLTTYTLSFGGHKYQKTATLTWAVARDTCALDGAHLVKIEAVAENNFMKSLSSGEYYWIGLNDPAANDMYKWVDGTALGAFNGFNGGTVPASVDDCVDMNNNNWSPWPCTNTQVGVCECE